MICLIQVEDTGHILRVNYYRTFPQLIKPQYMVKAPTGCMGNRGKTKRKKLKLRIKVFRYSDGALNMLLRWSILI